MKSCCYTQGWRAEEMARAQLQAAAAYFLGRILPAATKKQFSELPNREVLLGAYRQSAGTPVTVSGRTITPRFTLKVKNSAVAVTNGTPALDGVSLDGALVDQPLLWLRYVADAKVDDAAAIRDLMGDVDTYAQQKLAIAGVEIDMSGGEQNRATSQQWADAIVANRASLPDNLNTLTEVPQGLRSVAPDLLALRTTLDHFFSYDSGAYYPRWTGAGRRIPDDLTPAYREKNVRELVLPRDQMYVYMLVPKALFGAANAEPHDYREAILRLSPTGSATRPFIVTLMHSVYKRVTTAHPFHDFIFFESEDGEGLAIPPAVRAKMSADLLELLQTIPAEGEPRQQFIRENRAIIVDTVPRVQLLADVDGQLDPPQGVLFSPLGDGGIVAIQCPLDKVAELAAKPQVRFLWLQHNRYYPKMDKAREGVDYAGLQAKIAAGKKDGEGTIVGIIDSGIDASHPAFKDAAGKTRIIAVWQQDEGTAPFANSPKAKNSGNAAYNLLNYGTEYTGANVSSASDSDHDDGHGTHVAGIAAGREVTTAGGEVPAGIASKAQIIAVRYKDFNVGVLDGIRYIFEKAKEANKPCVVNISLGSHDHAHDGTDVMSLACNKLLKDSAGKYLEGRAICAAAGNERDDDIHFGRNVAPFAFTEMKFRVRRDTVTTWIRSTDGSVPMFGAWIKHATSTFSTLLFVPGMASQVTPVGTTGRTITVSYNGPNPANGDFELRIEFDATAAVTTPENWQIFFLNLGKAVELHAWAANEHGSFTNVNAADNSHKVCTPATSLDVIGVANWVTKVSFKNLDGGTTTRTDRKLNDLSASSSPGPLRLCTSRSLRLFGMTFNLTAIPEGIEVAAPGTVIISARSKDVPLPAAGSRDQFFSTNALALSGTPMATPCLVGLIACMFADNNKLTPDVIQQRVRAAGRMPAAADTIFDAPPGAPDLNDWGTGKLNAPALKP
jgi:subtilisin family serine protease